MLVPLSLGTVSYTHLDVYKRQVIILATPLTLHLKTVDVLSLTENNFKTAARDLILEFQQMYLQSVKVITRKVIRFYTIK